MHRVAEEDPPGPLRTILQGLQARGAAAAAAARAAEAGGCGEASEEEEAAREGERHGDDKGENQSGQEVPDADNGAGATQ